MFVMLGRKPTDVVWPGDRPYSKLFLLRDTCHRETVSLLPIQPKQKNLQVMSQNYLDMIVQPVGYTQSANMGGGVVKFVPHNIICYAW